MSEKPSRHRRTPQETKELSYAHDRVNVYGENDKSSRKAILFLQNGAAPEKGAAGLFGYCTRGSVSNWWNGGGEDSVHSSVVAPAPQGLLAACCLRTKASITP